MIPKKYFYFLLFERELTELEGRTQFGNSTAGELAALNCLRHVNCARYHSGIGGRGERKTKVLAKIAEVQLMHGLL